MTTTPDTVSLALKALRLPTMAQSWSDVATRAAADAWTYDHFLKTLCDLELAERSTRRLQARLKASHLPPGKRLDTFDFSRVPSVKSAQIHTLAKGGEWLAAGANVLAFGGTGSGKTHCMSGIGYALIDNGFSVLFQRTVDMVQFLQAARRDLTLPQMLSRLDRIDVLILDDIGYARKDPAETSVLFELIAERYERRSLIITCDRPFTDWDTIFPDKTMTVAAIDRLVHHGTILEFGAESYRLREAEKRKTGTSRK